MTGAALKLGVVGVGSLGFHHARIARELPGTEFVGIHDTDADRLDAVGRELGVPVHPELESLLDRADAVVIAVPTPAHEAVGLAAVRRGIHALIEKPLAHSLEAADAILSAARESGALVQTGHVERFNSAIRAADPYLDELLFVESHRLSLFGPRGTDVAVVLDLMIHDLDLVLSLTRRPVTGLAAAGIPLLTPSPDIANARIEFEGGGVANLTASRVSMERLRKIRFFQPSGYLSLDLANARGEFLRLRRGVTLEPGVPAEVDSLEGLVERIELKGDGREPLRCELEAFLASVRDGEPVKVTGEDGRRALRVALEIVERIEDHVAATHTART
ncbi:MAG TPA: Gfo/Idh/MocA family oxidoreductase [Longimicrobiales bacterium]|nr:Gfo/Idh/MocA family oxidoreductase [Longimicrobiales bacterium]